MKIRTNKLEKPFNLKAPKKDLDVLFKLVQNYP